MKAKRLGALFLAGLLTLVPSVTLTSCGGGGGDGLSMTTLPDSLSGRTVEMSYANRMTFTVKFTSKANAKVQIHDETGQIKDLPFTAVYNWQGGGNQEAKATVEDMTYTTVNGQHDGGSIEITLTCYTGKLTATQAAWLVDGQRLPATKVTIK